MSESIFINSGNVTEKSYAFKSVIMRKSILIDFGNAFRDFQIDYKLVIDIKFFHVVKHIDIKLCIAPLFDTAEIIYNYPDRTVVCKISRNTFYT